MHACRKDTKNITKGIEVLRNMKTISGMVDGYVKPAEFWRKYDAGEFK
jgi:hypothetical protein